MRRKRLVSRWERGFTMMEIIIVFALIGVLGAAMLGSHYLPTMWRSRDTKRKSDLAEIAQALEGYANDFGTYPLDGGGSGKMYGCGVGSAQVCNWGAAFSNDDGTVYMAKLPMDNKSPARMYRYVAGPTGKAWKLYARLENDADPVLDTNGDGTYVPADDDYRPLLCGAGAEDYCNYGLSSSNITIDTNLVGY